MLRRALSTRSTGSLSQKLNQLYQHSNVNLIPKEDLQELWMAMERRRYNVNRIKWGLGITGATMLLLSGKQIKSWLSSTTSEVTQQSMDDPEFQQKVFDISKSTLTALLSDSDLQNQIQDLTTKTIENSILELYQNPEFISETEKLVDQIIKSDTVISSTVNLSEELLNDRELQDKLGQTIRNSLTLAFMPTYFHPEKENDD